MVRRNRQYLSHAPKTHLVVWRANSAGKIESSDCLRSSGQTEDRTRREPAGEISALPITIHRSRFTFFFLLLVGCDGGLTPLVVDHPIRAPQSQVSRGNRKDL